MGSTRLRRPPVPTDAERARSLALRGGRAALVGTGCPQPVTPLLHHVRADGSAVLLLPDDEPLLRRLRPGGGPDTGGPPAGETAVMLELTDRTAVDLREPVRGLLWISGRLWRPEPAAARRTALQVADAALLPGGGGTALLPGGGGLDQYHRLLDLGHGATLVRLDPGSAVLSDGDGSAVLGPVDLAAARPDPFCLLEDAWLSHLDRAHPEVMAALTRHLPPALRRRDSAVRPLGVDRCGLRLRVETPDGDHDVRLAFPGGASTPEELRAQVERLTTCPFRR